VRPPLTEALPTPTWHRVAERLIGLLALTAVAAIALIFLFIAREAFPLFYEAGVDEELSLRDLFLPRVWPGYDEPVAVWQPVGGTPKYNIIPLFVGSLKVTLLSMAMAVPVGVACAIFVAIYAPKWLREVVKPVIELLAGVPSVVLGFFALMVIATFTQELFGFTYRLNGFVAAVGLAMAIVPVIFTISEDALQAVPKSLSEAAAALGARKYQIALRVIVPAAIPGITAAVILGFGRAIGETMIVLMASGNAAVVELFDFSTSVRTVTATIAAELGEVSRGEPHWRILFMLGVMLFAITFVLNLGGKWATDRLHRKLTAG
jgi:phosphate transport system permease protein